MNPNWTANAAAVGSEESSEAFTAFLVHLSGSQRGTLHRLIGDTVCITQDSDVDPLVTAPPTPILDYNSPLRLHRSSESHELEVALGHRVWLNGELVGNRALLASGDVLVRVQPRLASLLSVLKQPGLKSVTSRRTLRLYRLRSLRPGPHRSPLWTTSRQHVRCSNRTHYILVPAWCGRNADSLRA